MACTGLLEYSVIGFHPLSSVNFRRGVSANRVHVFSGRWKLGMHYSTCSSSCVAKDRIRALKSDSPSKCASIGEIDPGQKTEDLDGFQAPPVRSFNPDSPPPFTLSEIRAAIPKHCWVRNQWKSLGYVLRDVVAVVGLGAAAVFLNNWLVWPLYWVAQGTMFWALFVLGHDCGHGSFSSNQKLNNFVGHLLHSAILVPYHGWRISHRNHHQNHGHVEKDESWHPLSENIYRKLSKMTRILRFTPPFPLLAYPLYLWFRTPGKSGSHFHPSSSLFVPAERKDALLSTICCASMSLLLLGLASVIGPLQFLKLYGVPYTIFVIWLDLVTYLHHHGHEDKLPWYRGKEWNYMRGGLTTLDRDYGWINQIHHDIGTHVIHHLFPQIPHYHLVEASQASKKVMGEYYREPNRSGPLPFHLIDVLLRSLNRDRFVSDVGDVVYYQSDHESQR